MNGQELLGQTAAARPGDMLEGGYVIDGESVVVNLTDQQIVLDASTLIGHLKTITSDNSTSEELRTTADSLEKRMAQGANGRTLSDVAFFLQMVGLVPRPETPRAALSEEQVRYERAQLGYTLVMAKMRGDSADVDLLLERLQFLS